MSRIVVTGGSGFIGSHVVDALADAGHAVTVLDHRVRPHRPDVAFEDVDLLDLASVLAATRGAEHVFHLAAVSNVNQAHADPVYTLSLNVIGTSHILEAARLHGGPRVHLASTVWVYNGAPGEAPADEATPFQLSGAGHVYTSSKMAAEMVCQNYRELYGVPFTILRYGIPYGPRMREELLIPRFIRRALEDEPLQVSGRGDQYRSFVYVSDLAEAHVRALGPTAMNQVYNLEGARKVTVLEVAERIRRLVGESEGRSESDRVEIEFTPERAGDFAGRAVSNEKAERELGWRPAVEFEDGLKETVCWFRKRWGL
jgi:UDP-glucose 4-epimerase